MLNEPTHSIEAGGSKVCLYVPFPLPGHCCTSILMQIYIHHTLDSHQQYILKLEMLITMLPSICCAIPNGNNPLVLTEPRCRGTTVRWALALKSTLDESYKSF